MITWRPIEEYCGQTSVVYSLRDTALNLPQAGPRFCHQSGRTTALGG